MKKKRHAITEHYLVPAVLFALNICVVHMVHAFVAGPAYSFLEKLTVAAALTLFCGSLYIKKQLLLAGALLFYACVAFYQFQI